MTARSEPLAKPSSSKPAAWEALENHHREVGGRGPLMRARATAMLATIATMGVVACTVMTGLHTDPPLDASAPPAGSCVPARPPPAPSTQGGPDDAKNDILVAFQHVTVGPDDGWDLDGLCTCAPSPESCLNDSGPAHCDSNGGRDNQGAKLLATLTQLGHISQSDALDSIRLFGSAVIPQFR